MAIGQGTTAPRNNTALRLGEPLESYAYRSLLANAQAAGFDPAEDPFSSTLSYDVLNPAIQQYAHFVTHNDFASFNLQDMLENSSPEAMDNLVAVVGNAWAIRYAGPDEAAAQPYVDFANNLTATIENQDEVAIQETLTALAVPETHEAAPTVLTTIGSLTQPTPVDDTTAISFEAIIDSAPVVQAPPSLESPSIEVAPEIETEPALQENTDFLSFLEQLNQGIAAEDGFDYNRDLLTYIQSDIHYLATIEKSLEESDLPQAEKDRILEAAATANYESELIVMDPDYEFNVDTLGLAGEIINAGFNNDSEELRDLAETVVENGGQMPELSADTTSTDIIAAPTDPEDAPASDYEIPMAEHDPNALQITITDPILRDPPADLVTSFTIAATDIADAGVLLNGVAADDMEFLEDLVEEARELGVDTTLLTSISAQISSNDFVTSEAAARGLQSYAETLKAALENDDVLTNHEYKGALSNLFGEIAGGMVVDRAGMADDIAAAPGMEDQATRVMREALEAAARQTQRQPALTA